VLIKKIANLKHWFSIGLHAFVFVLSLLFETWFVYWWDTSQGMGQLNIDMILFVSLACHREKR